MRRMLCVAALSAWLTVFGTGCNTCCNGCRQPLFPRLHQWRHGARSTAPIAQPLPPCSLAASRSGSDPGPAGLGGT
ncbi:MAG: hypothetical protein KatS3mg105_2961 [Gemmatales bacterium]|nr:MAG: hypothetical protein KatS3mg105_2961 [Gemmatales bacterium]